MCGGVCSSTTGGNAPLRKCGEVFGRFAGVPAAVAWRRGAFCGVVDAMRRPVARVQLQRARRMHTAARAVLCQLAPREQGAAGVLHTAYG